MERKPKPKPKRNKVINISPWLMRDQMKLFDNFAPMPKENTFYFSGTGMDVHLQTTTQPTGTGTELLDMGVDDPLFAMQPPVQLPNTARGASRPRDSRFGYRRPNTDSGPRQVTDMSIVAPPPRAPPAPPSSGWRRLRPT
eukprot:gene23880-1503_t